MGILSDEWQRPSPRLLTLRWLQVATVTIPVAAVLSALVGAGASAIAGVASAVAVLVVGGLVGFFVQRRFHAWGYSERADDLLVRRGVMFRRLSVVPYGRMQYIDVSAGPFDRLLGLATVQLHTAAAASDARIPGLAATEAVRLRDTLAELGEAHAAGL